MNPCPAQGTDLRRGAEDFDRMFFPHQRRDHGNESIQPANGRKKARGHDKLETRLSSQDRGLSFSSQNLGSMGRKIRID